jgi:hypothetical protein
MRWLVVFLLACSGSPAPTPAASGPPASLTATAARNDVQVATVNGRPVWGSCVSAQASRGATRDDALAQCIDFELMAQTAEERGLATDSDVVLATRTALVSQLVAQEYEDKLTKPEDFGTFWTRTLERNRGRFDHPEARGSTYVRVEVAKNASPAVEQAAKQRIDKIYAALANERGLMKPHLEDIAKATDGASSDLKISTAPPAIRHGQLVEPYAAALFAIPEIGRVSPPARTNWGWDVVLWDSVVPEVHATQEEIVATAMPEIKRSYFPHWVNQVAKSLGVQIQIVEKNLPLLENR